MTLYHWTHLSNAVSILQRGLLTSYHQTAVPTVYACVASLSPATKLHTSARHEWPITELVRFTIFGCEGEFVIRFPPGVYRTTIDVPPERIWLTDPPHGRAVFSGRSWRAEQKARDELLARIERLGRTH